MQHHPGKRRTPLAPTFFRLFVFALLFQIVFSQGQVLSVRAQAGQQLILNKTTEGSLTTAQVGDVIRYRIRFECSSLTGPCGQMEITDVLPPGLIYQPPPASSVPAGFTISYNAGTRTITILKDDNNLLDGSQYDAVIAVRVDYDLRPLPSVVNNTVNGRIDPPGPTTWIAATPSSAPPITVGTASPHWGITKSLFSPTVNPTVDTDVTYQIQLCPTTPPAGQGNVPLRNIVLTDTLPAGAAFVSASDGGTASGGVVTWPTFAGPLYPPSCLTRFVTIRYNSPAFSVGNNVTNTASANGQYTDSSNNVIGPIGMGTDPLTHPIDPIAEVPTYSKDDIGDPVGIHGTGRFLLNLNTNSTNYPSNQLILVDHLPPQLQVTGVTSGGWSADFDHVSATVEYSTNNGSSYTPFPGQPVLYNSNATYPAPVANITDVRWVFAYDPDGTAPFTYTQAGLPYSWSFTSSPEIRVIPRASAVDTDPPAVVTLPAAIAGTTYDNCLQVNRTNSLGAAVTDPCNTETMTVQGDLVSLRTYKQETPGTGWDDVDDPLINNFTADGSILPGDTLRYTITIEITERSSAPLINPTIQDTLPPADDFVFVRNGTARLDGTQLPPAQQPTFVQAGQVLTWTWNDPSPSLTVNPLSLGSRYLTVEFFGYVPRGQDPGTYTNNLYTVTDSTDVICEVGSTVDDDTTGNVDSSDVDVDDDDQDVDDTSPDPACRNPDTYVVERSAALRGEKWIRSIDPDNAQVVNSTTFLPDASCPNGGTDGLTSIPTNPFTRYPCISQAFPEGALSPGQFSPPVPPATINPALDDFEYNLRIFNDGNVPMLRYVLYDILPYVGDTGSGGTLSGTARQSEFRPILRGPVQFLSGPAGLNDVNFTIEYNNTTNPCRPEVFNQSTGAIVPAGCNNTWTTTWSTSARSYRIRLISGSIASTAVSSEVRFGVPMYIPADAPPAGADPNDALSHEIAWNSYSHVGSYDKDPSPAEDIQDLLASEPRKVGITIPEVLSVGNRVWRDADNSGTINAPDDTAPGIAGVTVNLYRDADNNGIPDGAPIGTTTTDSGGYYLFSNIPSDAASPDNNRYLIGIPAGNFGAGQPLESLRSSTGTPANALYTNPPANTTDRADDGIDPATPGSEVFSASFTLQPTTEPTAEADLSSNNRDGLPGQRRGVNGERDNNSDLTLDFGFFGGTDIPFSLGNHVWRDNGQGGGIRNDGIRQSNEPPVAGISVRLYRDGNGNGTPETGEMIRTDVTDANGFYLFDNLDPGPYFVEIPASEFGAGRPLAGWYSSQPTGTENTGVNGGTTTADIDNDDNGVNSNFPENTGIFSGVVVLTRGVPEPTGEIYLSGNTSIVPGFNPTAGDGPGSIGRFGETDATSNMTIDFGFIPPMSLGNRVWFDEGAGSPFRVGYNNGVQDGTEAGVSGVRVELWLDNGNGTFSTSTDALLYTTTTDATGYYLFERLQPGNYFVRIAPWNFAALGRPLRNYLSSTDTTPPLDDALDLNDNGIDNANPAANGITSPQIAMAYGSEPLTPANETDLNNSGTYGPQNRGNYGQEDSDSNLTIDFGFARPPRSLGNRLWIDTNNNGQVDGGEGPVPAGVRVSLYLDANADNQPDDLGVPGDRTDDWLNWDTADANGYYLFDGLPPDIYIVGVDRANFAPGGLLEGYNSSTGSVDNAANDVDNRDNGVDRLLRADPVASPHGILSTRINLAANPLTGVPTGEVGSGDTGSTAGFNPTAGDGPNSRGRFGETDANSDLTIDFGFFIPMSLGNRVFRDDGAGGGTYNNGIMDGGEVPFASVRVELYRDTDANGVPDGGLVQFDVTDANGYYLFDDLAEGSYVVLIPSGNFTASFDPDGAGPLPAAAGALLGYNSSTPTGTEDTGVTGNPYTPNSDRDDNGINAAAPQTTGILSGTIVLTHDSEPSGEAELSGQADPGAPVNLSFNPTGWDGPASRGRWDESEINSNLTVDFGFTPIFSLGNRVWFDTNNDSQINAGEAGVNGVTVELYAASDLTNVLASQTTASGGYYLFNNLQAGDYVVSIPASNFSGALNGYWSSGTTRTAAGALIEAVAAPAESNLDSDDNGTLQTTGAVTSSAITLGPNAIAEPAGETDLNGGSQGQPDTQANMTVDFGFYTITLGNLVWNDSNNNGVADGGETVLPNVEIELWSADLSTLIAADTTDSSGMYGFNGLPQGDYVLRIPAAEFNPGGTLRDYVSSTGGAGSPYEPAPSAEANTADSDDNGSIFNGTLGLGGYVQSSGFTLTPAGEGSVNNALGLTSEPRIDFGLYASLQVDLTVSKTDSTTYYVPGLTLTYTITVTNDGPSDVTGAVVSDALPPQIASWDWVCAGTTGGATGCDGATGLSAAFSDTVDMPQLSTITYMVTANIAGTATGRLDNSVTVTPPAGVTETNSNNNTATDSDEPAALQVNKDDGISVVSTGSTLTYTIVVTNSGTVDLTSITVTDTLPADLTYQSASPAPTSIAGHVLTWSGLSLTGSSSTTIAVVTTLAASPASTVIDNRVDVTDTNTKATATDTDRDSVAGSSDFSKALTGTNHLPTTDPDVTIGEILTYELVLNVPTGSLDDTRVVDLPQTGLAFVDLISVTVSNPDTDAAGAGDTGLYSSVMTFDAATGACTNCADGTTAGASNPLIQNSGSRLTFDLGTLTNSTAATETVTIRYSLVVLDISANQSGSSFTNDAVWTWTGGRLQATTPPLQVVEPDLMIDKNADVTKAPYGTPVTFTLDVVHLTAASSNAYDVVVTDVLPAGLTFIPGSLSFSGVAPTSSNYDPATFTLTCIWDELPAGQTARVTFRATFVGPAPVTNSANVYWTSLPIDPVGGVPVIQSPYHPNSTERWYDPADLAGLNNYGASDAVTLNVPPMPRTGFAPGVVTTLPDPPASYNYTNLGKFWVEIPALNLKLPIVGVPLTDTDGWDLTWLGSQAGWLQGTAYPTHAGNSVITAHAINAEGQPGPFVDLGKLYWGQQVIVHLDGQKYIFEVREVRLAWPDDKLAFRHEEYSWLTLITCKEYNRSTNTYAQRVVVRAVLISVENE